MKIYWNGKSFRARWKWPEWPAYKLLRVWYGTSTGMDPFSDRKVNRRRIHNIYHFSNPHSFACSAKNCQVPSTFNACSNFFLRFVIPLHLSPLIPLSIHKSHAKTRCIRKAINHKMFCIQKRRLRFVNANFHNTLTFKSKGRERLPLKVIWIWRWHCHCQGTVSECIQYWILMAHFFECIL